MPLLKQTLEQACQIKLDNKKIAWLVTHHLLDDQFYSLTELSQTISQLEPSFRGNQGLWHELLVKAQTNINKQLNALLRFYVNYFEQQTCIGDFTINDEAPDVFVILGCNPSVLEKRVNQAIPLLKEYETSPVVLSGGGFNFALSEARRMEAMLLQAGISSGRMLLEPDSMDTIGNALFSKLQLKQQDLLTPAFKLLVVTSKFHAHRSLNYFKAIFHDTAKIAVYGVTTFENEAEGLKLAKHELQAEQMAQTGVFCFSLSPEVPQKTLHCIDDQTLLFQLLLKHRLYKDRIDLVRKFLPLTEE